MRRLIAVMQAIARPDLRLLVMSATLGGGLAERCATALAAGGGADTSSAEQPPSAPILTSEGRSYPVRISYLGKYR
jgi:ATP-dependent helicase HrpB